MSESTAVEKPQDWAAMMAKAAMEQAQTEKPDNNWISFKSGVLQYNDQPAKNNRIQCVIFDAAYENGLYTKPFDPNKVVSPDCWAIARVEEDLAPSNAVPNAVSPECTQCPNNEWGSDPRGGKGKACKNIRRIALVQASDLEKGTGADVLFARIPTMSVRNWSKYVNQIANVVRRPSWGVITELSVVPDSKSQFQVQFSFVQNVPDELMDTVMAIKEAAGDSLLVEYTPNPVEEEAAPAKSGKKF
jgi:hypothetical protein